MQLQGQTHTLIFWRFSENVLMTLPNVLIRPCPLVDIEEKYKTPSSPNYLMLYSGPICIDVKAASLGQPGNQQPQHWGWECVVLLIFFTSSGLPLSVSTILFAGRLRCRGRERMPDAEALGCLSAMWPTWQLKTTSLTASLFHPQGHQSCVCQWCPQPPCAQLRPRGALGAAGDQQSPQAPSPTSGTKCLGQRGQL